MRKRKDIVLFDGSKIKEYRMEKNISRYALSQMTGISANTIAGWENRTTEPTSLEYLDSIARCLECNIDNFCVEGTKIAHKEKKIYARWKTYDNQRLTQLAEKLESMLSSPYLLDSERERIEFLYNRLYNVLRKRDIELMDKMDQTDIYI